MAATAAAGDVWITAKGKGKSRAPPVGLRSVPERPVPHCGVELTTQLGKKWTSGPGRPIIKPDASKEMVGHHDPCITFSFDGKCLGKAVYDPRKQELTAYPTHAGDMIHIKKAGIFRGSKKKGGKQDLKVRFTLTYKVNYPLNRAVVWGGGRSRDVPTRDIPMGFLFVSGVDPTYESVQTMRWESGPYMGGPWRNVVELKMA